MMTAHFTLKDYRNGYYELINGAGHYVADISTTSDRKGNYHNVQGVGAMIGYLDRTLSLHSINESLSYFCKQYDEWFALVHKGVPARKYVITDEHGTVLIEQDCKDIQYEPFAQQEAPEHIKELAQSLADLFPVDKPEPVKEEQAILPLEELMPIQVVPLPGETVAIDKGIYAQMQGREWDDDGKCELVNVKISTRWPSNIINITRVMLRYGYKNLIYSNAATQQEKIQDYIRQIIDVLIANGILTEDSTSDHQNLRLEHMTDWSNDTLDNRLIFRVVTPHAIRQLSDIMYNAGLMVQDGRRFVLVPA